MNQDDQSNRDGQLAVKSLFGQLVEAENAKEAGDEDASGLEALALADMAKADVQVRESVHQLYMDFQRAQQIMLVEPEHSTSDTDFGTGVDDLIAGATIEPPIIDKYVIGPVIGPEIGRGGFGVVYQGEQVSPVHRAVAIKLLRTDLATAEMVARFELEATVLARMSHEGITNMIDAGLDHLHRPFVVMELVEGEKITSYCSTRELALPDRVRLIQLVCQAVHHAHQRAVIHRDLKPSNIIVEDVDGRVRPRVIDFGIAKLIEDGVDHQRTLAGHRLGTPRYMSPEQVSGGDAGDVRIDVYALGVILSEVLTETQPQLFTPSHTQSQVSPAGKRSGSTLQGDLALIYRKATAMDPEMRYQSAQAMGDDLERYLSGDPIEAAPRRPIYLTRKFIARRRLASAAIAVASVSIVTGAVALTYALGVEKKNSAKVESLLLETQQAQSRSESMLSFLFGDVLDTLNPDITGNPEPTTRELLGHAAKEARRAFAAEPGMLVEVLDRIGESQLAMGDFGGAAESYASAVEVVSVFDGSTSPVSIELRINALLARMSNQNIDGIKEEAQHIHNDARDAIGPDHPSTLRAQMHRAHIILDDRSLQTMFDVISKLEELGLESTPVYLESQRYLGGYMILAGDSRASRVLEKATTQAASMFGKRHTKYIDLSLLLGSAMVEFNELDRGESVLNETKDLAEELFGEGNRYTRDAAIILRGIAHDDERHYDSLNYAKCQLKNTLGMGLEGEVSHADALAAVGESFFYIGEYLFASRELLRAMRIYDEQLGQGDPKSVATRVFLAEAWVLLGENEYTLQAAQPVLDLTEQGDQQRIRAVIAMDRAYIQMGQPERARELMDRERQPILDGQLPPNLIDE